MKKILLTAAFAATSLATMAGGFLTNTNQTAAFLRNPALDAKIGVYGAYANPAGVGFMKNGFHLGVDWQLAFQTRTITSTFGAGNPGYPAPFSLGQVNGVQNPEDGRKFYKGTAFAPVIPSFDLGYVHDKFFASFHFGVTGGGGKCNFDDGIGSFESQVAMLPALINSALGQNDITGYSMESNVAGRQYYFSGQLNLGYRFNENWAVSLGGRLTYASCSYTGSVKNIQLRSNMMAQATGMNGYIPAGAYFERIGLGEMGAMVADKELNCDQTALGFSPVVGLHFHNAKWDVAGKYEFKTRLRLENKTEKNTTGLPSYDDGNVIKADVPALLTVGAAYKFHPKWRASVGFHYYFDKLATQENNKQELLNGNTWEVLAGMEYKINKNVLVSAGWQSTNYGLGKNSQYITDMSFATRSNSFGIGAQVRLAERVRLNISAFKTFYKHYKKDHEDYCGLKAGFAQKLEPYKQAYTQATAALTQFGSATNMTAAQAAQYLTAHPEADPTGGQLVTAAAGYQKLTPLMGGAQKLGAMNTSGYDVFHRTNTVFGLGVEIDF